MNKTGVYTVEGSTLTMQDKTYTLKTGDTCHPEWNAEKHPPLHRVVVQWGLGQTEYGPALITSKPGGRDVWIKEKGKGMLGQ